MGAAQIALENWCTYLSLKEIDKYLTAMKLKTSGARFKKLDRASKLLLGDYTADDLIATTADVDEYTAWVERANLRHTFVDRVYNGEIETSWARGAEENEPHSLEYVGEDKVVKIKLEQTRLEIATRAAEKSSLEQNETDDHEQEATVGDTLANENADSSHKTVQQHTLAQETANQAIPAKLSVLLTQLTQKVTELAENQSILQTAMENWTQNAHHAPAWSTRLDQIQSGHRQVGFQDTFTFRYPEQQHANLRTPSMSRQQPTATYRHRTIG